MYSEHSQVGKGNLYLSLKTFTRVLCVVAFNEKTCISFLNIFPQEKYIYRNNNMRLTAFLPPSIFLGADEKGNTSSKVRLQCTVMCLGMVCKYNLQEFAFKFLC